MTDDVETAAPPGGGPGRHRSPSPARRRGAGDGRRERSRVGAFLRELGVLAGLVLVLTALLRGLVFEAYVIPSGSMENTLEVGDKVLVNKLSYRFGEVERGDVVVFDGTGSFTPEVKADSDDANPVVEAGRWVWQLFGGTPANEEDFVKRVVGVGGDKVECRRTATGFAMYVNGARLAEDSYLHPDSKPCEQEFRGDRAIVVPEGRLWVMGDHRSLSADSREHVEEGHLGTVPEDAVIGRGFAVVWPTSHWRTLPTPATFGQRQLRAAAVDGPVTGPGPGSHAVTFAAALVGVGVSRRLRERGRPLPR